MTATAILVGLCGVAFTVGAIVALLAFLGFCCLMDWCDRPFRDVNDSYSG